MKNKVLVGLAIMVLGCFTGATQIYEDSRLDVPIYRLFPTENMYNFIQLDTVTGQMYLIQYDLDAEGKHRGGYLLNGEDLAADKKAVVGRFTLYPTENMWTFILLDQIDGGTWQVQWSLEKENRFVIPIFS